MRYLTEVFIWMYVECRSRWMPQRERETGEDLTLPLLLSFRDGWKGEHFKVRCLEKWRADICFSAWLVVERGDWQLGSQNRLAGWKRRWQGSSLSRHLSWQLAHICASVQVCVFTAQVCRCVGVCIYVLCVYALHLSVCVHGMCVHAPLSVPVSLHKRRLSWQLAALLGSWCAKFCLLLSNIQTPPNHQPAKETWPVLDASYPLLPHHWNFNPPTQAPAWCQDCHIALFWHSRLWAAHTPSAVVVYGSDHRCIKTAGLWT